MAAVILLFVIAVPTLVWVSMGGVIGRGDELTAGRVVALVMGMMAVVGLGFVAWQLIQAARRG
jgi:hypothetical protein